MNPFLLFVSNSVETNNPGFKWMINRSFFSKKKNFANKLYVFIIIIIIHNLQFNQSNHHIYNSRPIHFFFVFCCQSKKRFKILKFFKIFNKILKLMMIDWIECNILFCFWWWKTTWKTTSCFFAGNFPV